MQKAFMLILGLCFAFAASAALPPLSQEDRENNATDIVEGVITSLGKTTIMAREGYLNDVYQAEMTVDSVKKGGFAPSAKVKFSFWKMNLRPAGWAGPIGQNSVFAEGTRIRAYLINDDADFTLIMPNGFDQLDQ